MSDSREAFEQLHAIPSGAIWCEKRHIYIHKNYSGLVLHPINESWEAFCEGALWQASRQDFEGEPIGYVVPRMLEAMQAGKYCGISISDEKKDGDIAVYTHPASADKSGHWAAQSPGLADQYRQEAFAAREALGFFCDSLEVSPADIRQAIADKQAVRVPDVGDMADVLGDWVRSTTGVSLTHVTLVDIVRVMLAAPQQPPRQEQDHE